MKKISDYFGTKTAIKCENEQQWDKLKELCGDVKPNYYNQSCNKLFDVGNKGGYWEVTTYSGVLEEGYQILPNSDFVCDVPELVGVEMEVSDDGKDWYKRKVYGQCELGYIAKVDDSRKYLYFWKHARPIQPKKVLTATLTELAEMLNVDEIQLK